MSELIIFVATRREEVPDGCRRYFSVDGAVPGAAVCWDHHQTGEAINLDAMPGVIDTGGFDGVGSTMADADAVASVVAVLFGGKDRLPARVRAVLETASYWCDHLKPRPGVDAELNEEGRLLLGWIAPRVGVPVPGPGEGFDVVCRELARRIRAGEALPQEDTAAVQTAAAQALVREGRLSEKRSVALLNLRGVDGVDPMATYALHRCPVAVTYTGFGDGRFKYTVGVNPFVADAPADLAPALRAVAAAEFRHGAPALAAEPVPGAENWGGRASVFGSPWNYGSRLAPEEVRALVAGALGLG